MKLDVAELGFLGVILIKVYMDTLLDTALTLGKNPQSFFRPAHLGKIIVFCSYLAFALKRYSKPWKWSHCQLL